MVGGSFLGEAVVKTSGEVITNELSGQLEYIPNGSIYAVGAVVVALTIIPLLMAAKYFKKRLAEEKD